MKLENNIMKLVLLDKCSSHLKPSVSKLINDDRGFIDFIPADCTSLVQPLDLVINKPFRDKPRELFEQWLVDYGLKEENMTENKTFWKLQPLFKY